MPPKKKPKTKEEIKEQKRIAERLRYQRLKNDPEKREQLKVEERRNYQIKKEKEKKSEKYRKRLERLEKAKTKENVDSPNTKLLKMCDSSVTRRKVVKKALFGEVFNAQLKENYSNLKTCKEKQIFGKVVSGELIHMYKLWRSKDSSISYKTVQKSTRRSVLVSTLRTRKDKISSDCIKTVRSFYEMMRTADLAQENENA
ncbi:unnamed protein product [Leptosia nina]|uniref:Uncharacterized protein n=1 Tax=Leptosia nina TaxID=320188 RepID=A0AAV1K1Y8_9NEOP